MRARPPTPRRRTHRRAALGLVVAATLALSACGAGPATNAGLTGDPIVIGGSAPATGQIYSAPETEVGLRSAVASINAAGGINGRPLQLEFCDGGFDPNREISCARQLVAKKVVATISPDFTADVSGTAQKLLDDAGIPQIGVLGKNPASLNSPQSFVLSGGQPGWFYGIAAAFAAKGAKKVGMLVVPSPSSRYGGQLVSDALHQAGIAVSVVEFDQKADPTGQTATALATQDGVDALALATGTTAVPVLLSAARNSGFTGTIAVPNSLLTPEILKTLGPSAEGLLGVAQTALLSDKDNPGVARYLADTQSYGDGAPPKDLGLFSWTATMLFAKVTAKMTLAIDAPGVLAAFNDLSTPIDVGSIAPWSIAGKTPPDPQFSRLLNPSVQIGIVRDGVIVPDGAGFVDPFAMVRERAVR
jgi:branched-chain amino acid transport system substrate-binding protein